MPFMLYCNFNGITSSRASFEAFVNGVMDNFYIETWDGLYADFRRWQRFTRRKESE